MAFNVLLVLATSIASLFLSVFVFIKGDKKASNITFSLFSLALFLWTFGQVVGEVVGGHDEVLFWTRVNVGAAVMMPALYLHFVLSLIERREVKVLLFSYAIAFTLVFLVFTPLFVKDVAPVPGYRYYPEGGIVYPFFALYLLSASLYSFARLAQSLYGAPEEKRRQLGYVFFAYFVGFLGGITAFFPVFKVNFPVLNHFTMPVYAALTAYAIIKHKLLDINIVIRGGLVYSALTFLFAGFYAITILLFDRFFQDITRFDGYSAFLIAVGATVAVFQPLRDRIQEGVDRLFFKGKYYYEKTINDLSLENRKLYQTLLRADKLASLGTMAAGMAHEIKNPLASIKGMTQILPENMGDPEFVKDYAQLVPRQLDRIDKIVENLMKAGKAPRLEKKEVNVNDILSEVLAFYDNLCGKQGVKIVKHLGRIPPVFADPDGLHQIFTNIILNAVQAMANGGELKAATSAEGERALIVISDTGCGIPADKLDRIFDPFFSLKEGGKGLGLFTAYRIVQEHNGFIDVESDEERGTTFKIWLYTKQKE